MASLQDLDLADLIAGSPSGLLLQSFNALTEAFAGAVNARLQQEEDEGARSQELEEPMLLAQLTDKQGLSPLKAWMQENPEKDPSQYRRDIELFTEEGKAAGRFTEKAGGTGGSTNTSTYKGGSDRGKKNPDDVQTGNGEWVTKAQYEQLMRRREQMKQEILLRGGSGSGRR